MAIVEDRIVLTVGALDLIEDLSQNLMALDLPISHTGTTNECWYRGLRAPATKAKDPALVAGFLLFGPRHCIAALGRSQPHSHATRQMSWNQALRFGILWSR